ncbi:MAG: GTP cyclohydrolase FolE2 [Planctomycetota bacterium]
MKTSQDLPDVQSYDDGRNLGIDQVGVTSVAHPIRFISFPESGEDLQNTIGTFDLFVSLRPSVKGTHMSRLVQLLRGWHQPLDYASTIELCGVLRERMEAERALVKVRFPFFVDRDAPVTGESGVLRLDVELEAAIDHRRDLIVTVAGPAMSLCPCSKEIADYGAHSQRCQLTVSVRFRRESESLSINELFRMMEQAASARVYSILKRSDEKRVTEDAYDNPKFVEDTIRDLALSLKSVSNIAWFRCATENFESIHQHNAYACIERSTNGGPNNGHNSSRATQYG